jgi:hypothetical protein
MEQEDRKKTLGFYKGEQESMAFLKGPTDS